MTIPSFHDFFDVAEREIITSNPDIDPAQIRRPGSDANIVCIAPATMADQLAQKCRSNFANLYFSSAKGDGLHELGKDRYRLVPFDASVSRGYLTLYRNDTSAGTVAVGRGTVAGDSDGKLYETIEAVSLSGTGPINIRAVSKSTGSLSNARNGSINRLVTALDDPNVRVCNSIAVVRFTRAAAGDSGTIPAGTRLQDGYGNTYQTMEALAFTASQTVGLVPVKLETGHGFNAAVETDTITTLLDTVFDTFVVTNPVKTGGAFSGGDDDEQDGAYVLRCETFFEAARRGVLAAIEYGAKIPGVRHVQVFEEILDGSPTRAVHVLVADVNGIGNDALVAEVLAELNGYKGGGIALFVTGGQIEQIDLEFSLGIAAGYDSDVLSQSVRNICAEYLSSLPPSTGDTSLANAGIVQVSTLFDKLKTIEGLYVPHDAVQDPAEDYVPVRGNSARSSGTITVTMT